MPGTEYKDEYSSSVQARAWTLVEERDMNPINYVIIKMSKFSNIILKLIDNTNQTYSLLHFLM